MGARPLSESGPPTVIHSQDATAPYSLLIKRPGAGCEYPRGVLPAQWIVGQCSHCCGLLLKARFLLPPTTEWRIPQLEPGAHLWAKSKNVPTAFCTRNPYAEPLRQWPGTQEECKGEQRKKEKKGKCRGAGLGYNVPLKAAGFELQN